MSGAFTERMIAAGDGLRLYVRDYAPRSPGPAVLCLAGLTRNSRDFSDLAERLSQRHRVICIDYRGRSRSEWDSDWRNYTGPTYVDDIGHVLTALDVHRVLVVGTSLGGLLAMGLAVARPGSIAGIVLNDIGPEVDAGALDHIVRYVENPPVHDDWAAAVKSLKRTFPDLPAETDAEWEQIARNTFRIDADGKIRADWDPAIVRPARKAGGMPDYWPLFAATRGVPVLVVRGALSTVLTEETLKRMQADHPRLTAVTIDGVGHPPSLGEPESIAAIEDLLRRVVEAGTAVH